MFPYSLFSFLKSILGLRSFVYELEYKQLGAGKVQDRILSLFTE